MDRRGHPREIGPVGTAARVAGGLIAIVVPIAISGITWWDIGAALVALPLLATAGSAAVTAAYRRLAPHALGRTHLICSGPACVLSLAIIALAVGLSVATSVSFVAFWAWLGASMLLAAARGYAGCEMLAFPNAITGRRDRIGCLLYTPIDVAEARHRSRGSGEGASVPGGARSAPLR
jgi:hypothetical protein